MRSLRAMVMRGSVFTALAMSAPFDASLVRTAVCMSYNRLQLLRTIIDILRRFSNGARLATPARDLSLPLFGLRISSIFDVLGAFGLRVHGEDMSDRVADGVDASRGGSSQRGS